MNIQTALAAWLVGTMLILWLGITTDLLLALGTGPLCHRCHVRPADWDMTCLVCLDAEDDGAGYDFF